MHTEQKIIERLKRLPPQQLDEVIRFIDSITEVSNTPVDDEKKAGISDSILNLRGRGKGEQLVKKLLLSRREDIKLD